MRKFLICIVLMAAMLVAWDNPKIRGRIQDYEKADYALVIYQKNRISQSRKSIVEAGFKIQRHERSLNAYRVSWSGNNRKDLERKLKRLAESPDVLLIEPDPKR